MTKYTAPERALRTRRGLSRRTKILAAGLLLPISLLAIASTPAGAAPRHNPIFATIQFVNNAISSALSPIQNAIAGLQTKQTNLQTQQNNLATQISNLQGSQGSTGSALTVYDANGTKLGLLINHHGYSDTIYSSALGKFIEISDNEHGNSVGVKVLIIDSSGIGNILSTFSPIYYQSTDCSGTPFLSTLPPLDESSYGTLANDVMSFGDGKTYFVFHVAESPQTFTPGSYKTYDAQSATATCTPDGSSTDNRQYSQLYPVSLPFSLPVAEPLQFKYQ